MDQDGQKLDNSNWDGTPNTRNDFNNFLSTVDRPREVISSTPNGILPRPSSLGRVMGVSLPPIDWLGSRNTVNNNLNSITGNDRNQNRISRVEIRPIPIAMSPNDIRNRRPPPVSLPENRNRPPPPLPVLDNLTGENVIRRQDTTTAPTPQWIRTTPNSDSWLHNARPPDNSIDMDINRNRLIPLNPNGPMFPEPPPNILGDVNIPLGFPLERIGSMNFTDPMIPPPRPIIRDLRRSMFNRGRFNPFGGRGQVDRRGGSDDGRGQRPPPFDSPFPASRRPDISTGDVFRSTRGIMDMLWRINSLVTTDLSGGGDFRGRPDDFRGMPNNFIPFDRPQQNRMFDSPRGFPRNGPFRGNDFPTMDRRFRPDFNNRPVPLDPNNWRNSPSRDFDSMSRGGGGNFSPRNNRNFPPSRNIPFDDPLNPNNIQDLSDNIDDRFTFGRSRFSLDSPRGFNRGFSPDRNRFNGPNPNFNMPGPNTNRLNFALNNNINGAQSPFAPRLPDRPSPPVTRPPSSPFQSIVNRALQTGVFDPLETTDARESLLDILQLGRRVNPGLTAGTFDADILAPGSRQSLLELALILGESRDPPVVKTRNGPVRPITRDKANSIVENLRHHKNFNSVNSLQSKTEFNQKSNF